MFSNAAGQATEPHPAAAAEITHPTKQDYVQAFSVYIDTLPVRSATAFMTVSTGMHNVNNPAGGMLVENLPGVAVGPGYAQAAVESMLPGFGQGFVAFALLCFAFTTIVAYYSIAEPNFSSINRKIHRPSIVLLSVGIPAMVTIGTLKTAGGAWQLGDIGAGMMAGLKIEAILILQKPALAAFGDYERQRKAGKKDPTFDPESPGIRNADFWIERLREEREN